MQIVLLLNEAQAEERVRQEQWMHAGRKGKKKDIGVSGKGNIGERRDQLFSVVQLACGQLINSFI